MPLLNASRVSLSFETSYALFLRRSRGRGETPASMSKSTTRQLPAEAAMCNKEQPSLRIQWREGSPCITAVLSRGSWDLLQAITRDFQDSLSSSAFGYWRSDSQHFSWVGSGGVSRWCCNGCEWAMSDWSWPGGVTRGWGWAGSCASIGKDNTWGTNCVRDVWIRIVSWWVGLLTCIGTVRTLKNSQLIWQKNTGACIRTDLTWFRFITKSPRTVPLQHVSDLNCWKSTILKSKSTCWRNQAHEPKCGSNRRALAPNMRIIPLCPDAKNMKPNWIESCKK